MIFLVNLYNFSALVIIIGFIATFGLTVYGLLVPGKIPKGYLKALFSAVLIELVAGFFALFYAGPNGVPTKNGLREHIETDHKIEIINPKQTTLLLDEELNFLEKVVLLNGDTLTNKRSLESLRKMLQRKKLLHQRKGEKVYITSEEGETLGYVFTETLKQDICDSVSISNEMYLILAEHYIKQGGSQNKYLTKDYLLAILQSTTSTTYEKQEAIRLLHYVVKILPVNDPKEKNLALYDAMVNQYRNTSYANKYYELGSVYWAYALKSTDMSKAKANAKKGKELLEKYLEYVSDKQRKGQVKEQIKDLSHLLK